MRVKVFTALAAALAAGVAQAQEAPTAAAADASGPDPAMVAEYQAALGPRIVVGGVPPADARVAEVGDCVWASMSAADRRARLDAGPKARTVPDDRWDYPSPLVKDALFDADLVGRVRACDPNMTRHWRYSVLAGAAVVERETARARLARLGLTEATVLAAWERAPEDLRTGHAVVVDDYLRGTNHDGTTPEWEPLFRRLGLKSPRAKKDGWDAPMSPAQAAVRDYLFARELHALIAEHMTRPFYATPVEAGAWVLDHRPDMARFYPQRASEYEVYGKSLALCTLTEEGGLSDCKSIGEGPAGYGFGAAAERGLPQAWRVRMDSVPKDAVGKRVRVLLNWTLG